MTETFCPGCGCLVTTVNAGGYQTYCEKCVELFPAMPDDGRAYQIYGIAPLFHWVCVEPKPFGQDIQRHE